ncbi:MAG: sulfatase [Bryobacteraceae bacterium]|nr:sulfatase [Bryobacteraceae bacterium]
MNRRDFLALAAAPLGKAQPKRLPNFVFILMDDMGWRDTGYNGSTFYETPNIDALSKSGMTFTDGYSACPVCSPTRAAIMTGKYPARTGVTVHLQGAAHRLPYSKVIAPQAKLALDLEERTIAEALRERGYRTACIGKWHLGKKGFLASDQGFDVAIGGDEAGSTNDFFFPGWRKKIPIDTGRDGEYLTDRLTDEACKFVRESAAKPFFLYLPHFAVHTPIQGKPDLVAKYAAKKPGAIAGQNFDKYAAMIESADQSVGRVMKTLDELKLTDNTVVFFTSDNGGEMVAGRQGLPITSNAPLRSSKAFLYEGGIRVPLIVRAPGLTKAGSRSATPVSSVDYAPTIAEMAGASLPPIDGVSLTPVLRGGSLKPRALFWHFPHYPPQRSRPGAVIRRGDEKLILHYEDMRAELFDLKNDIGETTDLANSKPGRAKALRGELERWLKDVGAAMPRPNPNYDPAREWEQGEFMGPVPAK